MCLSGVSGDLLHAFQVFQVTVQVSNGTLLNDLRRFQVYPSGAPGDGPGVKWYVFKSFEKVSGVAFRCYFQVFQVTISTPFKCAR